MRVLLILTIQYTCNISSQGCRGNRETGQAIQEWGWQRLFNLRHDFYWCKSSPTSQTRPGCSTRKREEERRETKVENARAYVWQFATKQDSFERQSDNETSQTITTWNKIDWKGKQDKRIDYFIIFMIPFQVSLFKSVQTVRFIKIQLLGVKSRMAICLRDRDNVWTDLWLLD